MDAVCRWGLGIEWMPLPAGELGTNGRPLPATISDNHSPRARTMHPSRIRDIVIESADTGECNLLTTAIESAVRDAV